MAGGALDDVVVLELSVGVAGAYAAKLFTDLGAQVIKAEPAAGDRIRAERPLIDGESAFFDYLNGNKLSVQLDLADPRIDTIAAHADVIVHNLRGPEAGALDARLAALNPAAVIVSLTPYGRSGPRAGWHTSPLTEWATSGFHYIAGDPQREPLSLPGFQAEFHAGMHAGVAAMAALWHARHSGQGQRIEISHQEALLSDHAWVTTLWTHAGQVQKRTGALYARCADGYVYLFNLIPYPNLFVLMGRLDLLEDEGLMAPLTWQARFGEVFAAFSEWAATRTKQEIYHAAQELRVAISPVNDMADIAGSTQLHARDWFGKVEAGGRTFHTPGAPYKLTASTVATHSRAPGLGEHTETVLSPQFAWANASARNSKSGTPGSHLETRNSAPAGPLDGIRVVEVTAHWAGPIAGRHLADLGAEVIKVELATKPATRSLAWVGGDVTWPRHYHRSGYFNKLNRNKKGVCLDLATERGRELFLGLVGKSDVVLENNSARVMANLGIAYDTLREVNPGIVMCSITGFGHTGPERNYSAFGSNIETTSGLASLLGYGPGDAFSTGTYYADPITGTHAAFAILAALHVRRTTGRGQWIDCPLLEAVAPFYAQELLDYTVNGHLPEPCGNRWGNVPQDVFRTAGADCWLAVTITDPEALAKAIGLPAGEARNSQLVTHNLASWCLEHDHNEAAEILQAAGIPAAPVMANWEIVGDNHLNDRGFFVRTRHPEAGTWPYPGFPWRFESTPASVRHHAPLFAQHNHEIFSGVLGLTQTEIAALYESNITADAPAFAAIGHL
ncbi:MAG: CoA transferase [Dehalococcoidia bacterium]|nr:CoA transferase [Dehalococcoidia bacterium]